MANFTTILRQLHVGETVKTLSPTDADISAINSSLIILRRNEIFGTSIDAVINFLYVLITLVNFTGNGVMIYLIIRHRHLRTPINCLLMNLGACDIIAGVSIYPYVFLKDISQLSSTAGVLNVICSLTEGLSLFFVASGVSLSTLCAVSFYRYALIRFPLRAMWTRSKRAVKILVALMWLVSITVILPSAVTYRYSPRLDVCVRDWLGMNNAIYRSLTLFITMILPTILLILCYLALRIARRKITRISDANTNRIKMMKRGEQLVTMLLANFVICWTPFFIYWAIATFTPSFPLTYSGQTRMLKWVRITVLFAAVNSSIDPILFAASNREMRKKAKKLLFRVLLARYSSTTIVRFRVVHQRQRFSAWCTMECIKENESFYQRKFHLQDYVSQRLITRRIRPLTMRRKISWETFLGHYDGLSKVMFFRRLKNILDWLESYFWRKWLLEYYVKIPCGWLIYHFAYIIIMKLSSQIDSSSKILFSYYTGFFIRTSKIHSKLAVLEYCTIFSLICS